MQLPPLFTIIIIYALCFYEYPIGNICLIGFVREVETFLFLVITFEEKKGNIKIKNSKSEKNTSCYSHITTALTFAEMQYGRLNAERDTWLLLTSYFHLSRE